MKKTKGLLEKVLFEQENVIPPSQTDPVEIPKDVSLDMKVDKYLMSYEKSSIPTSQDYEVPGGTPTSATSEGTGGLPGPGAPQNATVGESKKKFGLASLLFEAEGDVPPPGGAAGGGDIGNIDVGAGLGADVGEPDSAPAGSVEEAPVIDTPRINLQGYASGVARLIQNYEALLNPKETILNRAIEYIKVNYDEPTSKMLEEMLSQNFDIKKQEDTLPDKSKVPYATGALVSS